MSPPYPRGAEAIVEAAPWRGRACVAKRRVPKTYRHPALDAQLRGARTRDEASLLLAARRAGILVPVVYDVDRGGATVTMEAVDGPTLRTVLASDDDATAAARLHALGALVARLHAAGLTHGDLTTSNVLVPAPDDPAILVPIDFGLGQFTDEDEPRGVDLHLVEEALESTDARAPSLFTAFLSGYAWPGAAAAVRRLEDIRERGRYR